MLKDSSSTSIVDAVINNDCIYCSTERGLVQLESQVNSVREVTGIFGSNKEWTNPSLRLWSMNDSINDIHHNILLRINAVSLELILNALSLHCIPLSHNTLILIDKTLHWYYSTVIYLLIQFLIYMYVSINFVLFYYRMLVKTMICVYCLKLL